MANIRSRKVSLPIAALSVSLLAPAGCGSDEPDEPDESGGAGGPKG